MLKIDTGLFSVQIKKIDLTKKILEKLYHSCREKKLKSKNKSEGNHGLNTFNIVIVWFYRNSYINSLYK